MGIIGPQAADATGTISVDSELQLRSIAEEIRDDLLALPEVAQVSYLASRNYQIDIEFPEDFAFYGLTLRRAASVRRENRELPAGSIRSESQEVLLRGNNRRTGSEIAKPMLLTRWAVLTVDTAVFETNSQTLPH